jgi:predicted dehydrogenase
VNPIQRPGPTRRQLLLAGGSAFAAASLARLSNRPLLAQGAPPESVKPLGWAFVGLGSFTQNQLLPGITRCKHSKCVAVVTGTPDKVNRPNRKLGGKSIKETFSLKDSDVYSYENYDTIKNNPAVDVIYIVLPGGMHAEYTIRGFQAGKHVMCEKPMANSVAECQQMLDAARTAGKKLQIGYRMHWDSPTAACIAAIRKGEIGKVQSIEVASGFNIGRTGWRLNKKLGGGGCLMDIGVYAVSAARYLSGEEPTEVVGRTRSLPNDGRFTEVESDCEFDFKLPSGITVKGDTSYSRGLSRFAVNGDGGIALMQPSSGYMEPPDFRGTKFQIARTAGGTPEPVDVPPMDQFVGEMDGFSVALQNAAPFKATGEEGLQDVRIMMAIYESARTGQPVKLT